MYETRARDMWFSDAKEKYLVPNSVRNKKTLSMLAE